MSLAHSQPNHRFAKGRPLSVRTVSLCLAAALCAGWGIAFYFTLEAVARALALAYGG